MTNTSSPPVAVQGLGGAVVGVSAGLDQTCAVLADGHIQCWGYNAWGALGNGTLVSSSVPVTVSDVSDAVAVSAGYTHTCAVTSTGRVLCWGQGLDYAMVSKPVEVPGF